MALDLETRKKRRKALNRRMKSLMTKGLIFGDSETSENDIDDEDFREEASQSEEEEG